MLSCAGVGTVGSGGLASTNNSWNEICRYSLRNYADPSTAGSAFLTLQVNCRVASTSACAYWEQPVAVKFTTSDVLSFTSGGLPTIISGTKELALLTADVRITFDGMNVVAEIKGITSTTINWSGCLTLNSMEWDS